MKKKILYYLKKILSMMLTLLAVSFFVFAAFDIIPGDAAASILGTEATESSLEALRARMGLDRPFLVRYADWLGSCLRGELGMSYSYNMPVAEIIGSKIPITLIMAFMAFIMTVVLSIPLGIISAKREGSAADKILYGSGQVVMAVPAFFLGILFTYVFGLLLRLFVPGGYVSYSDNLWGFISYLIFPAIAIALPKTAMTVRLLRSSILAEGKKNYVRTAYSRGNSTSMVLYKHVLKNAMIPVVTFLGMVFTDMIAGSIVVEQVFNIPGLGRILLTSVSNRDYPVVEAVILFIAIVILIVNLLVDILYRLLDPRVGKDIHD